MKTHLCLGDGHYEEKIYCSEDHVLVLIKISWDFRRSKDTDQWGSKLLNLLEMQQITKLLIERHPWVTKHLIEVVDINCRKEDSCHDLSSAKICAMSLFACASIHNLHTTTKWPTCATIRMDLCWLLKLVILSTEG
jgi:hypothetical protein